MITAVELAMLLRGADRSANLDAIADLIDSGLSAFVIEADAVLGMQNTRKGDAALNAVTLPPTAE
jgi:hypothetical protein